MSKGCCCSRSESQACSGGRAGCLLGFLEGGKRPPHQGRVWEPCLLVQSRPNDAAALGNIAEPEAKGEGCCLLLCTPSGGEGSGVWGALGW